MRTRAIISLSIAVALVAGACSYRRGEVGTKSNPVRFFFMPLKGEEAFAQNAPLVQKFLEEKTGLFVRPIHSPDFLTIIKAFANNEADVAFMNTLGYLMARDWAGAEARLLLVYGDVYKTYRGVVIARVGSEINSVEDLSGKTIAFSDPFSAGGYLYTLKLLNERGVKPGKVVFAGGHKKAVEMVYSGLADAAGVYHERPAGSGLARDARAELLSERPDVMARVKIIALTDEIPSGPVAFNRKLPDPVKSKLTEALARFSKTEEGRGVLGNLYNASGLEPTSDSNYNGVQDVIKKLGHSVEEMVPGGITFYNTNISPLLAN